MPAGGAGERDRLSPGALPLYTGELGLRLSGELLLLLPPLSGERRCLPFTLPGSAPPPAASGGVALGAGGGLPPPRPPPPPPGPVLLPTEAEGDRVGLCWLPRRSWYGTVARIGWSSRLVPAEPPPAPLPGPPAVPAVGDPAAPRLILCGGGWWWDGGVCEELDEDMAGTRRTPAGHWLRRRRGTRARPPAPRMHRPRGEGEEGEGWGEGAGRDKRRTARGSLRAACPAAPGASYRRRRLLLPRRALAIAARPSVESTGGAAEPSYRSHRTALPAQSGRRRGTTRGHAAGAGRGEGARSQLSLQLLPPPAPGSRCQHHPLPTPSALRMAPRSPGTRPRRAGVVGARAHWAPPRHQRGLYWPGAPSLVALSQWVRAARRGRGRRRRGGPGEVGCGGGGRGGHGRAGMGGPGGGA